MVNVNGIINFVVSRWKNKPVFTEAGVFSQNKSLKVQYEMLTASGLNG